MVFPSSAKSTQKTAFAFCICHNFRVMTGLCQYSSPGGGKPRHYISALFAQYRPVSRLNGLSLDYRIGLDLYQPVRVDEAYNLHYSVRRPDFCKEFAVYPAHALPIFYILSSFLRGFPAPARRSSSSTNMPFSRR